MVSLMVNPALHRLAALDPEIVVRLLTEVRLNDGGVVSYFFRCAFSDLVAKVNHHHTVAYPHDEVHVMFDEQDCHSPFICKASHHPQVRRFQPNSNRPLARREEVLGCIATDRAIARSRRLPYDKSLTSRWRSSSRLNS